MSAEQIQAVNELATCGGLIAGTVFWIFVMEVIFGRK